MRQALMQGRPDLALTAAEQGVDAPDVMTNMNRGLLRRMNHDFAGSNEALESAKQKIEELCGIICDSCFAADKVGSGQCVDRAVWDRPFVFCRTG
jgi:hypothetical protein